ncbi:MAG TPA: gliding motility-associated C-terminal domain-containing protein, partial [Bacteroidia bacterium]|nr:gliding motility-associated C-terminal domain-containing protein [Bacteroidia bacterium]
ITDYCKNDQPESEEQCSILLTGSSSPFEHNLKWNNYINWKQNVNSYTIERAAINEGEQLSDKYVNLGSDTLRTDNDLPLNDGIFGYRIRAKENGGGNDGESYSNIIELTQNPILYAPNAFSPNGDNDNETWGVERAFVKDYSIDLYNRWGQLIFQSTNTLDRWDGTYKGTEVPQGVYFYKMRFTGYNDRKVFEKLGSITVVR